MFLFCVSSPDTVIAMLFLHYIFLRTDGALIGGEGEVGVMEGEGEEEGGWDVGDDDLDLPPDLVGAVWHTKIVWYTV